MKRKRIAFVINGLYGGGAESVLQVVLANFDRQKYDITLISHRQADIDNKFYPSDIKYKSILKQIKKNSSWINQLWVKIYNKINLYVYEHFPPRVFRQMYLKDKFNVEIAFIEGYATRIVSGGCSDKKIAWVHADLKVNPWTDIAFRSKKEELKCYSLFDEVISVSNSVKKSFEELFDCKSIVIYNPIDTERIRRKSSQYTVEREKEPLLFISVGRLVPQKGYDRLIPIISKLISEGFDFRLWIVGEGGERESLEVLIREGKLENIIKLWGYKSNPYPYMKVSDFFICCSRTEGYSTVVTESLILGLPVITTCCAGMKELLEDNKYGIIVENENDALLNGMRNILVNKELNTRYIAQAVEGGNRFSLNNQMNEIYKVIDRQ